MHNKVATFYLMGLIWLSLLSSCSREVCFSHSFFSKTNSWKSKDQQSAILINFYKEHHFYFIESVKLDFVKDGVEENIFLKKEFFETEEFSLFFGLPEISGGELELFRDYLFIKIRGGDGADAFSLSFKIYEKKIVRTIQSRGLVAPLEKSWKR